MDMKIEDRVDIPGLEVALLNSAYGRLLEPKIEAALLKSPDDCMSLAATALAIWHRAKKLAEAGRDAQKHRCEQLRIELKASLIKESA